MRGSRISSISFASGRSLGRCSSISLPSVRLHAVDDGRRGDDQVEPELALEPLLRDLHVQQAQVAAAEAEAERAAGLGLGGHRRVVELQLLERRAQRLVAAGVGRIQPAPDHRLHGLEAGQRLGRGPRGVGQRVADAHGLGIADAGRDHADLAGADRLDRVHAQLRNTEQRHVVVAPAREQAHARALGELAVDDAHEHGRAQERVVPAVEDQAAQRRLGVALRRRDLRDDRLEDRRPRPARSWPRPPAPRPPECRRCPRSRAPRARGRRWADRSC